MTGAYRLWTQNQVADKLSLTAKTSQSQKDQVAKTSQVLRLLEENQGKHYFLIREEKLWQIDAKKVRQNLQLQFPT